MQLSEASEVAEARRASRGAQSESTRTKKNLRRTNSAPSASPQRSIQKVKRKGIVEATATAIAEVDAETDSQSTSKPAAEAELLRATPSSLAKKEYVRGEEIGLDVEKSMTEEDECPTPSPYALRAPRGATAEFRRRFARSERRRESISSSNGGRRIIAQNTSSFEGIRVIVPGKAYWAKKKKKKKEEEEKEKRRGFRLGRASRGQEYEARGGGSGEAGYDYHFD